MKIKLMAIWNSAPAWDAVSSLKKTPKMAYRLLKYQRRVTKELEVCEEQRKALVYAAAKVEPGVDVKLAPDSPEVAEFIRSFEEFLSGDSDLEWIGVSMEDLIDALDANGGNTISEQHIALLEPFFTEPVKADLKVVA